MRPVQPTDNLHTLYSNNGLLCIECKVCEHRASLHFDDIYTRGRSHKQLRSLKFGCSSCRSKDVALFLPRDSVDATAWVQQGQ